MVGSALKRQFITVLKLFSIENFIDPYSASMVGTPQGSGLAARNFALSKVAGLKSGKARRTIVGHWSNGISFHDATALPLEQMR
jgi:hypothetical protein